MSTITGGALINLAVEQLNRLFPGENLSSSEQADLLVMLNNIIDSASVDRLMANSASINTFSLTPGVASYSIGPAQAWNMTRPSAIEAASVEPTINGTASGFPIRVMSAQEFFAIPDRGSTTAFVRGLFYDRGYPTGTVQLGPTPNGGVIQIVTWAALGTFPDLVTTQTLNPGYQMWLILELAVTAAGAIFGKTPDTSLVQSWQNARSVLRQLNAEILGPEPPAGIVGAAAGQAPVSPSGAPGG